MKQSILLLLLCGLLLALVACKDKQASVLPAGQVLSAEEQSDAKYNAYRRSDAEFFGDFASRYRQVHAMLQQDYDFNDFYYFSDDLQSLQNHLQGALAMSGEHALDKPALDYLNSINALLPLDKKLTDYSNNKNGLNDGGAALGSLCRQLLPLLKATATAQHNFSAALQQVEDHRLLNTLHKYKPGSSPRHRLTALYYARRIYQGFADWFAAYDNQEMDNEQRLTIKRQLEQDILEFDKNAESYIASMPEKGSCSLFMNNLIDFMGESRALLTSFTQGDYSIKKAVNINTPLIRRTNDRLILKRHYFKVIESYNQGGCY
ncbi:hypothetical protein AXE65_03860 [Ventosimonas gracilis]|uniref:DUF3829 domain-containing protein n=1 Tax=Ventosimonas gracilis TaxID=1680762 RepID=A0A139SRT4_9GAMM|nr:DUF3829 domain-containing protein [Ventosimonas gracilis]KXU37161.1 hypothetical protein AXE65_03860 [Ventosimonas gracilis]